MFAFIVDSSYAIITTIKIIRLHRLLNLRILRELGIRRMMTLLGNIGTTLPNSGRSKFEGFQRGNPTHHMSSRGSFPSLHLIYRTLGIQRSELGQDKISHRRQVGAWMAKSHYQPRSQRAHSRKAPSYRRGTRAFAEVFESADHLPSIPREKHKPIPESRNNSQDGTSFSCAPSRLRRPLQPTQRYNLPVYDLLGDVRTYITYLGTHAMQ